jgi:hypothetical protein
MDDTLAEFEPVPPQSVFAALGLLRPERSGPVFHLHRPPSPASPSRGCRPRHTL